MKSATAKKSEHTFVVEGFEVVASDGIARIRDIDLGERLGYERPRDVRRLIANLVQAGRMPGVLMRAVTARMRNKHGERAVEVTEYWLTREHALLVCMRSDAKGAAEIQDAMIAVILRIFDNVDHRLDPEGKIRFYLLPPGQRTEWESMFPPSLVVALCRVYRIHRDWKGGIQPRFLGRVYQWLYPTIVSSEVYVIMKGRTPNPRHGNNLHQHIPSGDPKEFFRQQLGMVEAIANQSQDREDFKRRIDRHYRKSMLQLALHSEAL